MADAADEPTQARATEEVGAEAATVPTWVRRRQALVSVVAVLALLVGGAVWAGWRDVLARRGEDARALMIDAGREGVLALTTVDHNEVDADVQRILDASTGAFRDDFARNSESFKSAARQAQSTSVGTVREAGLESVEAGEGRVLVALTVMTSNRGVPEQHPKSWRTRVHVAKTDHGFKVTAVEFLQ